MRKLAREIREKTLNIFKRRVRNERKNIFNAEIAKVAEETQRNLVKKTLCSQCLCGK